MAFRGLWRSAWLVAGAVLSVVAALVTFLLWPSPHRASLSVRAHVYTGFDACLLTGSSGVSGAEAAPVWKGMQEASGATSGKVSFLSVTGPATVANAVPFVDTLATRKCDVVLAVGAPQVAAIAEQAAVFPSVRFVVVAGRSTAANVTAVAASGPDEVSSAVRDLVVRAADGGSAHR